MKPGTELRAKLRLRANVLVNEYIKSAMSRADFVELVHDALLEASALGMEMTVHGLYELSGLNRSHATTEQTKSNVTHTLQPSNPDLEDGQS